MKTIEVFADVRCPFTHVGLRRLVRQREVAGAEFVLHVRAWPLELVNDAPLSARFVAEEVGELREQVAPDLFTGFDVSRWPASSLPALALAAEAYRRDLATGERVSLALRTAFFEHGLDIAAPHVLTMIADAELGPAAQLPDRTRDVLADWEEGKARGVIGSPHFFVDGAGFFCPALRIRRVDGQLHIEDNTAGFEAFVEHCLRA